MALIYTPNYGIIDYSKHIWLVDTPHDEKIFHESESKDDALHLLAMESQGRWFIDEITVKGRYANFTVTYFIDNYLDVYLQRNQVDLYSPPFKTCPKNVSEHTCVPSVEQCYCRSLGLYDMFNTYKGLTYALPDDIIERVKSGAWVIPDNASRPQVMKHYVEAYMENKTLTAEMEAVKAESRLVHANYTTLENEVHTLIDEAEAAKYELETVRTKATRECDELRKELQAYDEDMTARLDAARVDRDSLEQHATWLQDELKKSQTQFNLIRPLNTVLYEMVGVEPFQGGLKLLMVILVPVSTLWVVLASLFPRRELV
jgi:hypothetical protein